MTKKRTVGVPPAPTGTVGVPPASFPKAAKPPHFNPTP